jgi:hypothetical protein
VGGRDQQQELNSHDQRNSQDVWIGMSRDLLITTL